MITKVQGFHGIKIAFAAIASILMAQSLGLENSISAGIVAILTVAPTKKETFHTASNRFYAFIVALLLSYGCFQLLGYDLMGFFLYLILFILLCQWRGWGSAMAMDSVLISHFLSFQAMTFSTVTNEIGLFFLGTGCGVLVNLHLREKIDYIRQMEEETDQQSKLILSRMAQRISSQPMEDYNGQCFVTMRTSLQKASQIAQENYLNQLKKEPTWDMEYIAMRQRQADILYRIYIRVNNLDTTPVTGECIAQFFQKLHDCYGRDNSAQEFLQEFYELREILRESPLPVERREFENRAELYAILGYIEEFMIEKRDFMEKTTGGML